MRLIGLVFLLVLGSLAVAGSLTIFFILFRCVENIRVFNQRLSIQLIKMFASLLIWAVLSVFMFLLFVWMSMAINHADPERSLDAADLWQLFVIAAISIGYAGIGWLLERWMARREEASQI